MKKIEGQISFDFNSEEEKTGEEKEVKELKKNLDKAKKDEKKTEDRIKVESVERVRDELTGELCYRIVLFWEIAQQPLVFVYYPKEDKVRWTLKPGFYISKGWWNKFVNRVKAVGSDHYRRDQKNKE